VDERDIAQIGSSGLMCHDFETGLVNAGDDCRNPTGTLWVADTRVVSKARLMFNQQYPHTGIFAFGIEVPNREYADLCQRGSVAAVALPDTPVRVIEKGEWPGPLTFRRAWARATARPWNDAEPAANLRLVRGSAPFLRTCTELLLTRGVPGVLSPPLPIGGRRTWLQVGYEEYLQLALMRRELIRVPPPPDHLVVESDTTRLTEMLEIDRAAFSEFWRFDKVGLTEAMEATGRSSVLVIRDSDGGLAGFAVIGFGSAIAYLQRVAVHPKWQGQGMGRSLIRVAARKARSDGARVMLLNTQLDNEAALNLYQAEGYIKLPHPLWLLRYSADGAHDE
jgi:ribosomal protein S18 acetylase RimI-like enzyme